MATNLEEKLLADAHERVLDGKIDGLCRSMASFIAEIDASSEDVAMYLVQRLSPILRHPAVFLLLDRVGQDGRKLVRAQETKEE